MKINNHHSTNQPSTTNNTPSKIEWDRIPTDLTFVSCYNRAIFDTQGFFRVRSWTRGSCSLEEFLGGISNQPKTHQQTTIKTTSKTHQASNSTHQQLTTNQKTHPKASRFRSCWCSFHHVLNWAGAFGGCCGASVGFAYKVRRGFLEEGLVVPIGGICDLYAP